MPNTAIDTIRELIRDDELERACELLVNLAREANRELANESILHTARLKRLRDRQRRGTLTEDDRRAERNQLVFVLLEFVDEVERHLQRRAALPPAVAVVDLKPTNDSLQEKIFGVSHLKSLAWLQQGLTRGRAICRILTPSSRGTGFLIGGGRVLTNHHVLPNRETAAAAEFEFNYEEDEAGRVLATHRYRARPDSFKADVPFDCAVVQVEPAEGQPGIDSWGALTLEAVAVPATGDHVTIIQHADGGLKQVALTANQVVNLYEHRLHYTTDTLPGSSGAPVFNDYWRVVALHHAGGNVVTNARGERMFANEGILITHVARALGL